MKAEGEGTAAGYQADVVSQEEMEVAMTAAVGLRPCALFLGAQRELHRRSPRSASLSTDSCAAPASSKLRRWRSGTRHTRVTRAPSEFARRREAPDTHTLSKRGSGLVLMTREMQRGIPPDHGDKRDGHDCESLWQGFTYSPPSDKDLPVRAARCAGCDQQLGGFWRIDGDNNLHCRPARLRHLQRL